MLISIPTITIAKMSTAGTLWRVDCAMHGFIDSVRTRKDAERMADEHRKKHLTD